MLVPIEFKIDYFAFKYMGLDVNLLANSSEEEDTTLL